MAGKLLESRSKANDDTYEKNLKWAVKILEEEHIVGVIEPICSYGVPGYYLDNFERGKILFSISWLSCFTFYEILYPLYSNSSYKRYQQSKLKANV